MINYGIAFGTSNPLLFILPITIIISHFQFSLYMLQLHKYTKLQYFELFRKLDKTVKILSTRLLVVYNPLT